MPFFFLLWTPSVDEMHRKVFVLSVPLVCFLLVTASLYLGRDHITRLSEAYLPLHAPSSLKTTSTETISLPLSTTSVLDDSPVIEEPPSYSTLDTYTTSTIEVHTTPTISSTTSAAPSPTITKSAIPIANGELLSLIFWIRVTNMSQAPFSLPSALHLTSTQSSILLQKSALVFNALPWTPSDTRTFKRRRTLAEAKTTSIQLTSSLPLICAMS